MNIGKDSAGVAPAGASFWIATRTHPQLVTGRSWAELAKTWKCQNLAHLLTEHIHSLFGLLIREPGVDCGYCGVGVVEDIPDHLDRCSLLSKPASHGPAQVV